MKRWLMLLATGLLAASAHAVMDVPSQGWDGALNITTNTTIDLSQAMTGTWNVQPAGYVAGRGIYDPTKWAITFHYTSITIANGATLKFTNHPSNPPIVWLVEGAVQINGVVEISGQDMFSNMNGESLAGPGAFHGGRHGGSNFSGGGGFGPGGGAAGVPAYSYGASGGYGTAGGGNATVPGGPAYGNPAVMPLLGGSGGGGMWNGGSSGGGGGGALLIGAQNSISVVGAINARGGYSDNYGGGGSGGAIRLISPLVSGSGAIRATGGSGNGTTWVGGVGRIRIEANTQNIANISINPVPSVFDPGETPQFWPTATTPTVRLLSLNGIAVPSDPHAQLNYPWQDIFLDGAGEVTALIQTTNVPTSGSPVQVFVTQQGGPHTTLPPGNVTFVGGNQSLATWRAVFTSTNGMFAVQARAVLP